MSNPPHVLNMVQWLQPQFQAMTFLTDKEFLNTAFHRQGHQYRQKGSMSA